jgi:hypothetical protein
MPKKVKRVNHALIDVRTILSRTKTALDQLGPGWNDKANTPTEAELDAIRFSYGFIIGMLETIEEEYGYRDA